jgi:hypothetical protein
MDPTKSSYSLIPTTDIDGNANINDLWSSNNGNYIQQITNNNIQQISPNNPSLQAPPGLGYARRYAASKPPYSCKFFKKKKTRLFIKFFFLFLKIFH